MHNNFIVAKMAKLVAKAIIFSNKTKGQALKLIGMILATVFSAAVNIESSSELSTSFVGCDQQQVSELNNAMSESFLMRTKASASLLLGRDSKIVEFFGNKPQNRWTAFSTVSNSLTRTFDITCANWRACWSTDYASGFISEKDGSIHLCKSFFKKRPTGYNSQAGALVTLQTVFTEVGATSFHENSIEGVKKLAKKDPVLAVDNAPSFGYFSESIYYNLQ